LLLGITVLSLAVFLFAAYAIIARFVLHVPAHRPLPARVGSERVRIGRHHARQLVTLPER